MPFDPPFSGYIQPPGIPPDPTGDCWRGPPGPMGPPGPVGTGDASNTPVTATGSTTPRMLQDRAAAWANVMDFGAMLDGATNDSAAYSAARTAANGRHPGTGGVVVVPYGIQNGINTAPTFAAPAVLWKVDCLAFPGGTPVTNVTTGDLVETFFTGQRYLGRTDPVGVTPSPVMRLDYTGAGTSNGVLRVSTTGNDANAYTSGIISQLTLTAGGGTATGPVGIGSLVTNIQGSPGSGSQGGWSFWGVNADHTGLGIRTLGGQIGFENGIVTNGPDNAGTYFNPTIGGRVNLHLVHSNWVPASWAANHVYVAAAVVTPGNGFTYIAQNAGTSGATAPTWPTSAGSVVDGSVTWAFGTTVQGEVSKAIHINGNANLGVGILMDGVGLFSDACIDLSLAKLNLATNPNAAAVRLAANMPIDFSADGSAAGQNLHTLKYDSTAAKLIYAVGGVAKWSVDASGNMRCAGTVTGSVTP